MAESDKEIIKKNLPELVEKTDIHCLLPKLVEKKVLTKNMVDDIEDISKPLHEQKRKFFLMIQERGPEAFTQLWETLAETGHFVAARLLCPDKDPRTCLKRLQNEAKGSGDLQGHSDPQGAATRETNPSALGARRRDFHSQNLITTDSGNVAVNKQPLQIKVRKSKIYRGPPAKKAYQMMSRPRGYALIINNKLFVSDVLDARTGSHVDVINLSELLKGLGYEVIEKHDLGIKDMEREVENFANMPEHGSVDSCVVAVLSHGAAGGTGTGSLLYSADSLPLSTEWLLKHFNNANCTALRHKPKLFILQACRGTELDYGAPCVAQAAGSDTIPVHTFKTHKDPSWTDMLIAYSTIPNMTAFRDIYRGSWFIECLCEVFMNHAHDTDLEKMMKRVSFKMMMYEGPLGERQMCAVESRGLFHKVYFNPGLFTNYSQVSV